MDWWIAVAVASAPLIAVVAAVTATLTGDIGATLTSWAIVAFVLALYAAMGWPLYYEVGDDTLLVRSGLLRRRIPLDQIARIRPSRNPLSSPALSLDRLQIDRRNGGSLLVSPADRTGFVVAILERARGVEVDTRLGGWSPAPLPAELERRRRRMAEEPTEAVKDGQTWQIGGPDEVAWIAEGTAKAGVSISVAIPPIFEAYATFYPSGDPPGYSPPGRTPRHEQAVVEILAEHTSDQPWWLGFLETGAHDVVFPNAPRVSLYWDWHYVLVQAGPEQALTWRKDHMRASDGVLPDLFFPADRSWLVSALWDDLWTCIGGPDDLIEALCRHPLVQGHRVGLEEDAKPPELERD